MGDEAGVERLFLRRAEEARARAAEARQAAERARARVAELQQQRRGGLVGLSKAEERRLLAEERLAQVEASLAEARQRSVNAHERAGRLDAELGRDADAQRHHDAANDDRQLIEDAATEAAQRPPRTATLSALELAHARHGSTRPLAEPHAKAG
jgi:DNA primase large subunit